MSKKVSQLTKELDITLQELKDYASKMGIEVKSAQSSVEDVDAGALPIDGRHGGGDGESTSAFLAVVVKRGLGSCMSTQTRGLARKMQHGLGHHGLARAGLADEHHILDRYFLCHRSS